MTSVCSSGPYSCHLDLEVEGASASASSSFRHLTRHTSITMAVKISQSALKKSSAPPKLSRQDSYSVQRDQTASSRPVNASLVLASVASRATSPGRKSPTDSLPSPGSGRRTSWEDCKVKRDGYVSFPDFDDLQASRRT